MYSVYYSFNGGSDVMQKKFETLKEATDFANKQPIDSVFEIKLYDNKTNNIQD